MEVVAAKVVSILARVALAGGQQLGQELGQDVAAVAHRLYELVMQRLGGNPDATHDADQFKKRPDVYQKPVEVQVEAELNADSGFAAEVQALLREFERTVPPNQIMQTGSGAIAVGGSVAAGEGGAAAGAGGTATVGVTEPPRRPAPTGHRG